jgi:hypothetical protein
MEVCLEVLSTGTRFDRSRIPRGEAQGSALCLINNHTSTTLKDMVPGLRYSRSGTQRGQMTLTATFWITHVKQFHASMDAASCRRDKRHGCRHPPPPARPNQSIRWNSERVDEGVVPARRPDLLKTGSVGLSVTPARKNSYQWRRPRGLRCLSLSESYWLAVEATSRMQCSTVSHVISRIQIT